MIHIPVEVLREIFTNLNLKDKLTCMFVCRLWYNTLDRFTLLRNISVNNTQFPKLKAMLERFPHRLAQMKCLELSGCNILLNVQEVRLSLFTSGNFQLYTSESLQFLHTTCKLEKLYTYYSRAKPTTKIEPVESFALKFICPSVELSFSTAKFFEKY